MADSSKNRLQRQQSKPSAPDARRLPAAPPARRSSQRTLSKKRREQRNQRLVLTLVGGALGLVVIALVTGVLYEQVWIPSRPLAQVGDIILTRRDYWQEQRYTLAQEAIQNTRLQALFSANPDILDQLGGRNFQVNAQVALIHTQEVNEQRINQWVDAQLIQQGAASIGIQVSDDTVNQQIVADLGSTFLPAAPITPTTTLTPTATIVAEATLTDAMGGTSEIGETATAMATATSSTTPSPTRTATPGGPTLTPTDTNTPVPTDTPRPTPVASVASEQVPQIIDAIYRQFETEVRLAGQEPQLTRADFDGALQRQYRDQLLRDQLQAHLLPETEFTATTEPDRIRARHILLKVEVPDDADEAAIDAAFAERRPEAVALVDQLRAGADFAELAAQVSEDPGSRDSGGDVGYFDATGSADNGATYDPLFVAGAFALDGDEISDPMRTRFGWHILQVTDRQVPDPDTQLATARSEVFNDWLEQQRAEQTIRRFPEPTPTEAIPTAEPFPTMEPTFLPGPPTPEPTPTEEPEPTPEPTPTEAVSEVGPPSPGSPTPTEKTNPVATPDGAP